MAVSVRQHGAAAGLQQQPRAASCGAATRRNLRWARLGWLRLTWRHRSLGCRRHSLPVLPWRHLMLPLSIMPCLGRARRLCQTRAAYRSQQWLTTGSWARRCRRRRSPMTSRCCAPQGCRPTRRSLHHSSRPSAMPSLIGKTPSCRCGSIGMPASLSVGCPGPCPGLRPAASASHRSPQVHPRPLSLPHGTGPRR